MVLSMRLKQQQQVVAPSVISYSGPMNKHIYSKFLSGLLASISTFLRDKEGVSEEILEDISTIIEVHDISLWTANVDGRAMSFNDLLSDLNNAIESNDRQKCLEAIVVLRCAIADVSSAFSNAQDSIEQLTVRIRDEF